MTQLHGVPARMRVIPRFSVSGRSRRDAFVRSAAVSCTACAPWNSPAESSPGLQVVSVEVYRFVSARMIELLLGRLGGTARRRHRWR